MAAIFTKPVILFEVFKINMNGNDAVETQKKTKGSWDAHIRKFQFMSCPLD